MRFPGRRTLVAVAVSAAVVGLHASPAAAYTVDNNKIYGVAPAVGTCGVTANNFVKAVQLAMWTGNTASSPSSIDGYFGPATSESVIKWQTRHRLSADRCFGYQSWARLQEGSYTCNGRTYPHMVVAYYDPNGFPTWRYSEPCFSSRTSGWTDDHYQTTSWHLSQGTYVPSFCLHSGFRARCHPYDGS